MPEEIVERAPETPAPGAEAQVEGMEQGPAEVPPAPSGTEPEGYRFKVMDEESTLPRGAVDEIARSLGWEADDVLRGLGVMHKRDRMAEQNKRERDEIARERAELKQQIETLNEIRRAAEGFDPSTLDPGSRFLMGRLDQIESSVSGRVERLAQRLEAREQEESMRDEIAEHYETINQWAKERELPSFSGRQFFKALIDSGLAESGMDWERAAWLNYRSLAFQALSKNGRPRSELPKAPPGSVPRSKTQITVPAAPSQRTVARDDTQPVQGETIEQKRERLARALGDMTLLHAHPGGS